MTFIANRFTLTAAFLTIIVTSTSNFALAKPMCVDLFSKQSSADSLKEALGFGQFGESFIRQLQNNPAKVSAQSLESGMKLFDKMAKAYFEKAKIAYELLPEKITIENLKDHRSYELNYFTYRLDGKGDGDSVARMLNGVQLNSKFNQHAIQFVVDPLFSLRGDSGAVFSWSRKKIIFGADVLIDRLLKKRETLRHEIQHYFEQIKLFEGQMTLARLDIMNESVPDIWYDRQLSGDELETHLRDLRFAVGQLKNKSQNQQHQLNIAQDVQILETSLLRIKKTIKEIETGLSSTKLVIEEESDLQYVVISLPNEGHAFVYLNGLVAKKDFENQAVIKEKLAQVLNWSINRISAIENEVQNLRAQHHSLLAY